MQHSIPHSLPIRTARLATRAALESYKEQLSAYQPRGRWLSEDIAEVSFSAAGRELNGRVEVTASAVLLDLEVPLLLRPFKSIAIKVIDAELQSWLNRALAGEFDEPGST